MSASADEALVRHLYERFNARDIDGVLANLAPGVAWANGMEGTHVHGHDAVREYWTHQWSVIDPHVDPVRVATDDAGAVVVTVHQVVHDLEGKLLLDETIEHVFTVVDGKIVRFDIRGNSDLKTLSY